jgi:8-oxo-dGTP pyrophosphatase MutT (NUDIX family)
MAANDIVFERDGKKFNFRSVAILIHTDRVLLHQINNNPYWSLPGGRVEFSESASTTVVREMKEELRIDCEVIRPLWVMENFFNSFGFDFHEIAFYFLLTIPQELVSKGDSFEEYDGKSKLTFKWHQITDLDTVELYPEFLRKALNNLPDFLTYTTHRD